MNNLKPCPFCGSNNIIPPEIGKLFAECEDCHSYGPSTYEGFLLDPEISIDNAIDLWNTRP